MNKAPQPTNSQINLICPEEEVFDLLAQNAMPLYLETEPQFAFGEPFLAYS